MRLANAAEVMAATGIKNPADVNRAPNRFYAIPFAFTGLATAQNTSSTQKNDAGSAFVVDAIVGAAWLTNANASTIAGTPLHDNPDPSPPAAVGNTHIPLTLLRVFAQMNDAAWMLSIMRWVNIIGTTRQPHIPIFNPIVAPGSNMIWTLYNDTTLTISAEIALVGHYIGVGNFAQPR